MEWTSQDVARCLRVLGREFAAEGTLSERDVTAFEGYADEFLAFADPDRRVATGLGVEEAPALLLVRQDGEVIAKSEGWNADEWRGVTESIAALTHWSRPPMPVAGDPASYSGTPISA